MFSNASLDFFLTGFLVKTINILFVKSPVSNLIKPCTYVHWTVGGENNANRGKFKYGSFNFDQIIDLSMIMLLDTPASILGSPPAGAYVGAKEAIFQGNRSNKLDIIVSCIHYSIVS